MYADVGLTSLRLNEGQINKAKVNWLMTKFTFALLIFQTSTFAYALAVVVVPSSIWSIEVYSRPCAVATAS
jgi:hypothetical protein